MSISSFFKYFFNKIILPASLFFTILTVIFTAVMSSEGTEFSAYGMTLGAVGLLLLFSLLLSCANRLFVIKNLSVVLKFLLHFVAVLLTILTVFIWIGGKTLSTNFYIFLAVLYVIALMITLIVGAVKNKKTNDKKDYKRQF